MGQVSVSTDPSSSQSATKSIDSESFASPGSYSHGISSNANKIQEKIEKSFDNPHKVIETDCQSQSLDKLSATKRAVVKELFKQTDRIAKVSTDSPVKEVRKVIKRKSKFSSPSKLNESARKRMKTVRDNLSEEIKEKEKQSAKSRMKQMRSDMPDKIKEKEKQADQIRKQKLRDNMSEEIQEKEKQADQIRKQT